MHPVQGLHDGRHSRRHVPGEEKRRDRDQDALVASEDLLHRRVDRAVDGRRDLALDLRRHRLRPDAREPDAAEDREREEGEWDERHECAERDRRREGQEAVLAERLGELSEALALRDLHSRALPGRGGRKRARAYRARSRAR